MDADGKNVGFDSMAVRMLEKLEALVSGHRSRRGGARLQPTRRCAVVEELGACVVSNRIRETVSRRVLR